MTRTSTIIEKAIATFLLLWGCLHLYSTIFTIYTLTDFAITYHISGWEKISFLTTSKNYYLSISGDLITIFGSIFLIFNKKIGWITSLFVSLLNAFFFLLAIFKSYASNSETLTLTVLRIIAAIFFLVIVFALTRLPFRLKYYTEISSSLK